MSPDKIEVSVVDRQWDEPGSTKMNSVKPGYIFLLFMFLQESKRKEESRVTQALTVPGTLDRLNGIEIGQTRCVLR